MTVLLALLLLPLAIIPCFAQEPTFIETFDSIAEGQLPAGWEVISGEPRVEGGRLLIDGMGGPTPMVCFGDPQWENMRVEVDVEIAEATDPTRWACLMWRVQEDPMADGYYLYTVRQRTRAGNGIEFARRLPAGPGYPYSVYSTAGAGEDMLPGEVHHLALEVSGSRVTQWLDGEPVLSSPFALAYQRGRLGFTCSSARAYFDNVKVIQLPAAPQTPASAVGTPVVVAHRGYSSLAPENTLAAFEAAIEAGAPAAECDVYCSKDGHVVLSHDATLDRTTDGSGPITDRTLEELRTLDAGSWKGEQYKGQRIPTLKETLELVRGKMQLVVEVKQGGISKQVVDTIREAEAVDFVTIISFSAATCREIRELEPGLPVGWLSGGSNVDEQAARRILGTTLQSNCQFVDIVSGAVSEDLMRVFGLAGVAVWVWTVDDPDMVKALAQMGVRGITTNDPAMALKALSE